MNSFTRGCGLLLVFLCASWAAQAAKPVPTHDIKHLFDIGGLKSDLLSLPSDVAVEKNKIYVVDSGNHRVRVFSSGGKLLFTIGKKGIGAGEFRGPVGIDVDTQGRIYVADTGNHRVQVFDPRGKFLTAIRTVNKDRALIRPIDVAVDEEMQLLYVTGNNNHKLMTFNFPGYLLDEWGGKGVGVGDFRYPGTLVLLPDKKIAVVDILNTRVQVFTKRGHVDLQVGKWGVLPGRLFRPKGLAVDKQGRFYISDSYLNIVQVFSDEGQFQYVLKQKEENVSMETPTGISVDENMRLYVAEMRQHKISVHAIMKYPGAKQ